MRPPVHSRHHYDSDDDNVTIGQGQKEKCKQSHRPIFSKGGKEFFRFLCFAIEWYFAD